MFLPVGDAPNSPKTPYVTYLLMAVNVAVFLFVSLPLMGGRPDLSDPALVEYLRSHGVRGSLSAREILQQVNAYDLFIFKHGFRPAEPSLRGLFSAMFLHGGWLHLAGNMLFLWIFGDNVEHRLGRARYLLAFLGTGVAATVFFALFVPDSQVPMIGASGAISGVLGIYFLWFPRNRVRTFVFLFPFIMTTFMIPARLVLGFYLLVDNLIPFLATGGGGAGVAHGAHIGGFLGGLALAYGIERWPQARVAKPTRKRSAESKERSPAVEIDHRLRHGDTVGAAERYFALGNAAQRGRLPAATVLSLGEALLTAGSADRALSVFRRFVAERPADPDLDRALLGAGRALLGQPQRATTAYQYFLAAVDAARSREIEAAARGHLRALEGQETGRDSTGSAAESKDL